MVKIIKILVIIVMVINHLSCKKVSIFASEGATLIISCDRSTLKTGGDVARITVLGFDGESQAIHNHTLVIFSCSLGAVIPSEVEMKDGRVFVEFKSGDQSGVAEIRARSGNIVAEPDPLQIIIGSAALENLSISATPANFNSGGGRSRVQAFAFDGSGNLLANIPLVLTASTGTFEKNLSVYKTDLNGMVEDYLNVNETSMVRVESGDKMAEVEITVQAEQENKLPVADFSVSPSSPKRGEKVNFNGGLSSDSDGDIVTWEWDFGDSKTGAGEKVTHTYTWQGEENRTFSVMLKVTDDRNGQAVTSKMITVEIEGDNNKPSADFSYSPSSPRKGEDIYFNGQLSTDPENDITSWEWDFGDGNKTSGESVSHSYNWDGTGDRTFNVSLKVTDAKDNYAITSRSITVSGEEANRLPTADFSYSPTSPKAGETIHFDAQLSSDPDGEIVSWEWNYGDGNSATGEIVNHSYQWTDEGDKTFNVTLKVTDNDNGVAFSSQTITVAKEDNQLPNADFSFSPVSPTENETVNFNGGLSTDPDGDIVSWEWDFGDGTNGRGVGVTHSYSWPGGEDKSFVVTLKVTDNDGGEDFSSKTINVQGDNQPPTANFTYTPSSPSKGDNITFDSSSSTDTDGSVVSWEWDFGDGTPASGEIVNHQYTWTDPGDKTFTVILKVTDNNGGEDTVSVAITVKE